MLNNSLKIAQLQYNNNINSCNLCVDVGVFRLLVFLRVF